ncbi:acetolactate synthase [Calycina marina]|uniref:Acetolactate synthase n=1 Tax=Calycina marina TaxID=1763456 RepID=A0A9P8CE62_9HELO|nr:acetolactate synthase [Calycina marina]
MEVIVKGQQTRPEMFPHIISCPNEMVALFMEDGFTRYSGKPQAVIVHVDVGTQGLEAAVHNASIGRAPVLIFAGISLLTMEGEMRGSRTENVHWMQYIPDQKLILCQYCRHTTELKTEGESPVVLATLPDGAAKQVITVLKTTIESLVITGYSELANLMLPLNVLDNGGSDMCFPADHSPWLGMRFAIEDRIEKADATLVLHCDVPWIPTQCKPSKTTTVVHIDVDTLNPTMPKFYLPAIARWNAGSVTAVIQVIKTLREDEERGSLRGIHGVPKIRTCGPAGDIRNLVPADTIFAIEAVTNTHYVEDTIQIVLPGSWVSCGGAGLSWSGGTALFIKLVSELTSGTGMCKFVVQIVEDGTFIFSVPGAVYWISQHYKIPILTILLNNNDQSIASCPPKPIISKIDGRMECSAKVDVVCLSDGLGSKATNEELNISFTHITDYGGTAKASNSGALFTKKVDDVGKLE